MTIALVPYKEAYGKVWYPDLLRSKRTVAEFSGIKDRMVWVLSAKHCLASSWYYLQPTGGKLTTDLHHLHLGNVHEPCPQTFQSFYPGAH